MRKGFACGVFDMFHFGHVAMLKECRDHCDYLIVAVNRADRFDARINPDKLPPLYSIEDRVCILNACKYVDEVRIYESEDELVRILKEVKPDIRFLGEDYKGRQISGGELTIPIHYCDRSHGLSTSRFKKQLFEMMVKFGDSSRKL